MSKEQVNTYYNSKNPSSQLNCLDLLLQDVLKSIQNRCLFVFHGSRLVDPYRGTNI